MLKGSPALLPIKNVPASEDNGQTPGDGPEMETKRVTLALKVHAVSLRAQDGLLSGAGWSTDPLASTCEGRTLLASQLGPRGELAYFY